MAEKASATLACSASSARKNNKPLMEKKRRARINDCLSELKSLVLQAMQRDTSRYSKLEKADILEMTVKHLRSIQRSQMAAAVATDPSVINRYRAGFNECAAEVTRYLGTIEGIDNETRMHLLSHLASCAHKVNDASREPHARNIPIAPANIPSQCTTTQNLQPIHVQIPSGSQVTTCAVPLQQIPTISPQQQNIANLNSHGLASPICATKITGAIQLIPSTLPSGQLAYIVQQSPVGTQQQPVQQNGQFLTNTVSVPTSIAPVSQGVSAVPVILQPTQHQNVGQVQNTTNISPIQATDAPVYAPLTKCTPFTSPISTTALDNTQNENVWRPW